MPNWKTILRDFIIIIIGRLSTNARRKAHKPERETERDSSRMSTLLSSSSTHDGRRRGRGRRVVNIITLANATAFVVIASMSCVFLSLFLYDIDDLEDAHFEEEGRRKTTTTTSFDASFFHRDRGRESDDFDDEKTTTTRDDSDVVHRDDDGLKEKTRAKTTTFRRQNSFPYRYVVYMYIFIYARKIDTLCVSLLFY